jgi:hypothetical protein
LRQEEVEERSRRDQLQYMGIFFFILICFIVLLFAGSYRVSETFIRVMNFFLFIMLFEFIIILADRWIHHNTDGEPLKMLALKIVLIAILYPLHHWVEKRAIHLLVNRTLIKPRQLSLRNIGRKMGALVKEIWGPG